ncbi:hypothetical protein MSG28_001412 [Choristoneura fumiferana]|uniref:Uncharacterized protein n=1 Tax=Choristoneura fumiferana TaxID=7141 RepID=A0ACC0KUJ9_CHOFU|nr:hypothetical protein MSG28_001412 [Choristoneura fumiferana]
MKFVVFLVVVVFAVAQAKYLMAPYALSEALEKNEIDDGPLVHAATQKEKLYIPMARYMSCSNGGCTAVCQALGYRHGVCVSDTTCECYN